MKTGFQFPMTIALVLAGLAVGPFTHNREALRLDLGLLALFLPPLLFEASWDIDPRSLRRCGRPIAVLAIPGTLLTAAIVALAARLLGGLEWPAALILGALVGATDPVAVLASFRGQAIARDLRTIIEGESIANDGVAAALVRAATSATLAGFAAVAPAHVIALLLLDSFGGIATGIAGAALCALFLHRLPGTLGKTLTTLVLAYGSYAVAEALGVSGIFACATAGVAARAFTRPSLTQSTLDAIERVWDVIAATSNAILFFLVGVNIQIPRMLHEPALISATLAAVALARILLAYVLVPLRALTSRPRGWQHVVALAGLRGGLSLALALDLPAQLAGRPQIIDAVYTVVFITLVVQGAAIPTLIGRIAPAPALADVALPRGASAADA